MPEVAFSPVEVVGRSVVRGTVTSLAGTATGTILPCLCLQHLPSLQVADQEVHLVADSHLPRPVNQVKVVLYVKCRKFLV